MASFQAKIGWKRPKKRKNKNYRSVPRSEERRVGPERNENLHFFSFSALSIYFGLK